MSFVLYLLLNPMVLLILGVLTFYFLRGKGADPNKLGTGGKMVRGLWIAVLSVFTLGFGACGAMGFFGGLSTMGGHDPQSGSYGALFMLIGGVGLLIAAATGFALYRALRPVRPRTPDESEPTR